MPCVSSTNHRNNSKSALLGRRSDTPLAREKLRALSERKRGFDTKEEVTISSNPSTGILDNATSARPKTLLGRRKPLTRTRYNPQLLEQAKRMLDRRIRNAHDRDENESEGERAIRQLCNAITSPIRGRMPSPPPPSYPRPVTPIDTSDLVPTEPATPVEGPSRPASPILFPSELVTESRIQPESSSNEGVASEATIDTMASIAQSPPTPVLAKATSILLDRLSSHERAAYVVEEPKPFSMLESNVEAATRDNASGATRADEGLSPAAVASPSPSPDGNTNLNAEVNTSTCIPSASPIPDPSISHFGHWNSSDQVNSGFWSSSNDGSHPNNSAYQPTTNMSNTWSIGDNGNEGMLLSNAFNVSGNKGAFPTFPNIAFQVPIADNDVEMMDVSDVAFEASEVPVEIPKDANPWGNMFLPSFQSNPYISPSATIDPWQNITSLPAFSVEPSSCQNMAPEYVNMGIRIQKNESPIPRRQRAPPPPYESVSHKLDPQVDWEWLKEVKASLPPERCTAATWFYGPIVTQMSPLRQHEVAPPSTRNGRRRKIDGKRWKEIMNDKTTPVPSTTQRRLITESSKRCSTQITHPPTPCQSTSSFGIMSIMDHILPSVTSALDRAVYRITGYQLWTQ
ncbi:hypothetical protein H0H92_015627 [Tricholoma furcatifolium]|nr:hypothetical protein H0H92_015627 [Tricholoma furcatifolium]